MVADIAAMSELFPTIIDGHWRDCFSRYQAELLPDEIFCNRIIRPGDLMHTPLVAKIDGQEWRPVSQEMIGQKVGTRRIRRPNK
jgi:hypothetical protein